MKNIKFLLFFAFLFNQSFIQAQAPVTSKNGMVVTAHPIASQIGIDILKKGGNAADAAVAVQFALAVVYPNAGNIGGGGFLVYRTAGGQADALDFRETAPQKAFKDMYLDKDGNPITELSLYGVLSSGIPGTIKGMEETHKKYGKLLWKDLIQPAIDMAKNGFKLTSLQAQEFNENREKFIAYNPEGCSFVKKELWKEGDKFVQADLAHTLELIRDKGSDGFYKGETAKKITAQMKKGKGIISLSDLKKYKAVWREPITGTYKEYKIISMPPPSSGGIALATLLKTMEKYPLAQWEFQQEKTIQAMVEAERRAYADRAEFLGDPDFVKIPQHKLLNPEYIKKRMSDIPFDYATPSSSIKAGELIGYESTETTHYSIVDKDRNAVSVTTTLNDSYGSRVVVQGAGFLLNDEMDDFSVKPGVPNLYGLVGGTANAVEPNKRMLSSMTPTILEKNGKLAMVVGTPGGSTIITSVFQTILNVLEFNMNMQEAVAAPRFHHQWLPDTIQTEEDRAIKPDVRKLLNKKGYAIKERGNIGRVDAVWVTPDNSLQGGADPRGDDKAVGY